MQDSLSQITEHLQHMLSGEMSLGAFDDWFADSRKNIYKNSSREVQRVAVSIDDAMSQFDEDCDGLRIALERILAAMLKNSI